MTFQNALVLVSKSMSRTQTHSGNLKVNHFHTKQMYCSQECQHRIWQLFEYIQCVIRSLETRWFFEMFRTFFNQIISFLIFVSFLQLSEVVNSLSPQGQLPLGIALMSRSSSIAQTLVQNGKADVNAYNGDVSVLLRSSWQNPTVKIGFNFFNIQFMVCSRVAPYSSML